MAPSPSSSVRKYCERVVSPELANQEAEPKYEFPTVVGLMSGENAPLEVALTWLGWKVRTYELLGTPFDGPKDLLDPAVRAEADGYRDLRHGHLSDGLFYFLQGTRDPSPGRSQEESEVVTTPR